MDVYERSNLPGVADTPNRWTRTRINQRLEERGRVRSVREAGLAVMAISSSAEPLRENCSPPKSETSSKMGLHMDVEISEDNWK